MICIREINRHLLFRSRCLRSQQPSLGLLGLKKQLSTYRRPPIISVLGHVDHGKTTLIDSLRQTNTVQSEAGGITQKNSVFQHTLHQDDGSSFTFTILDTPGHAAFSRMRVRGATLTDVAILIVAATESIKPQTVECIKILKNSRVPFVVALNKIDLPKADVDRCIEDFLDYDIEATDIGGAVPFVPISALRGSNISQLMTMVKTVTDSLDLEKDLTVQPAEAIVFDVQNDPRHVQMTVVVNEGVVRKGDQIASPELGIQAKITKMVSSDGSESVTRAQPGDAVRLHGFNPESLPILGSTVYGFSNAKRLAKRDARNYLIQNKDQIITRPAPELKDKDKKKISFMICADCQGTLDVLRDMFTISNDFIITNVFHETLHKITQSDIEIAEAIDAQIILFNVPALDLPTKAKVHQHDVIYELATALESEVNDSMPEVYEDKEWGRGVIAELHGDSKKRIIGVNKLRGCFKSDKGFRVVRRGFPIWEGGIANLRFNKTPIHATDPKTMQECGLAFHKRSVRDIQIGDEIQCFSSERVLHKVISERFFGLSNTDEVLSSVS